MNTEPLTPACVEDAAGNCTHPHHQHPPRTNGGMRTYLVVGTYESGERWGDSFKAYTPAGAEAKARLVNPEVRIAAVITGEKMRIVA